jgi:hypothetical protein
MSVGYGLQPDSFVSNNMGLALPHYVSASTDAAAEGLARLTKDLEMGGVLKIPMSVSL